MMFVRVTRGSFPVDNYDAIVRLVETTLIPAVKQLPGFRKYHGGVDRESGRLIAISYWETAEQPQAIQALRDPFAELGVQFETTEIFEIIAET